MGLTARLSLPPQSLGLGTRPRPNPSANKTGSRRESGDAHMHETQTGTGVVHRLDILSQGKSGSQLAERLGNRAINQRVAGLIPGGAK